MNRIVHLSSAHPRTDLRISLQCQTLAQAGYDVILIVADGLGDSDDRAIRILDVGRAEGRLSRATRSAKACVQAAAKLAPDVCQFHDPELLLYRAALQKKGIKVLYDAHEDLPRQILSKPYLRAPIAHMISALADRYLTYSAKRLEGLLTATPHITSLFAKHNVRTQTIRNYPLLSHQSTPTLPNGRVIYAGALSELRGTKTLVNALEHLDPPVKLDLFGHPDHPGFLQNLAAQPGWALVNAHGRVPHNEVNRAMKNALAGIVTLHPTRAYRDALPVKLFEYMAAGLPVIASDFPLWRGIVEEAQCGICVDPEDPQAIAQAIDWMRNNPNAASEMGARGQAAAQKQYNWPSEATLLTSFYKSILTTP